MNIVFIKAFIDPVGLAFGEVGHFTFLLKIFSRNEKRDQRFLSAPSQKLFCFFCAGSCFVNHAGSDPKNRRLAVGNVFGIPQNTGFFPAPFWPLERQNSPEFRGILGVASFLLGNIGTTIQKRCRMSFCPQKSQYLCGFTSH